MSVKSMIGNTAWMKRNPGRYAIYKGDLRAWHVTQNSSRVALCNTFEEAIKAAHAHAYVKHFAPYRGN